MKLTISFMDIKPIDRFITKIVTVSDQMVPSQEGIGDDKRLTKGRGQRP